MINKIKGGNNMKQTPISNLVTAIETLQQSGIDIKQILITQSSYDAMVSSVEYKLWTSIMQFGKGISEQEIADIVFESVGLPKIVILKDNGQ